MKPMVFRESRAGIEAGTLPVALTVFFFMSWVSLFSSVPWPPKPERTRLATGETVLYQKDPSSSMTVVELFVPGGKSAVPAGKDGLAYLVTRLALEIPDFTVAQDIMAQATRMRVSVLEDCSVISLECLSENLEDALRVGSEIIQAPLLSGLRIDNIKRVMALYAKSDEDDAVASGHAAAMNAFFGGLGYGGATYGTDASLKAIDKKDVTSFYGRLFTRNGVLFSVCSNLEKEKVRPLLEKYFAKFPAGPAESLSPTPSSLPDGREIRLDKGTKQTYVARAFLLPPATPADYARGYLLEVLLGVGPGSRLWDLRAEERLAYNVSARSTWTKGRGVFEAYLETENAKKDKAVAALEIVLGTLHEKGVSEDELRMTKNLARAQLLRSSEAKKSRAQMLGLWRILGLGFEDLDGVLARLDAVTADEMNSFIREFLDPKKSILVVVGGKNGR
jgi:predicted Zn-dependent peptidase